MSENSKKNSYENDSKTKPKLFEKGGPGGPGRGKKAEIAEIGDFKAEARKIISDLMQSKDEKTKAKGVELYMKHRHILDEESTVVNDSKVMAAIKRYANDNDVGVDLGLPPPDKTE